jgi:hypothetical protein
VTGELYDAYNAEGVAAIMNVTLVPCMCPYIYMLIHIAIMNLWFTFLINIPFIFLCFVIKVGNAEIDTVTKTVTCQHGADECAGNLWEMCSISHYPEFSVHFPFYYCLETHGSKVEERDLNQSPPHICIHLFSCLKFIPHLPTLIYSYHMYTSL